jgi:hypothetical protein
MSSWIVSCWDYLQGKRSPGNRKSWRDSTQRYNKQLIHEFEQNCKDHDQIHLSFSPSPDCSCKDDNKKSNSLLIQESSNSDGFSCKYSVNSDYCTDKLSIATRSTSRSTVSVIPDDECLLCLGEFDDENPQILTLCSCGENKSKFHYPCLLLWMERKPVCPTCDAPIFFQVRFLDTFFSSHSDLMCLFAV